MASEDDTDGGGIIEDEPGVHGVDLPVFPWVLGAHLEAQAVDTILKDRRKLA